MKREYINTWGYYDETHHTDFYIKYSDAHIVDHHAADFCLFASNANTTNTGSNQSGN